MKGAKGKKTTGGGVVEEDLNYDSTDSFGLPKTKTTKGRTLRNKPNFTSAKSESESRTTPIADADTRRSSADRSARRSAAADQSTGGRERDGISSRADRRAQPLTTTSNEGLPSGSATPTFGGRDLLGTTPATAESQREATPGVGVDLGDDFDSPDEEMDELLETTGTLLAARGKASTSASSLASSSASASASASAPVPEPELTSAAVPPLLPLGRVTQSFREDRTSSTDRALGGKTAPLSSTVAAVASEKINNITVGSAVGETLRRRSPSPPSSPRKSRSDGLQQDYRSGESLRSRRGRGLTYSGSRDDLEGGKASDKIEESGVQGGRLEGYGHGGVGSVATNVVEEGAHKTTAVAAESSTGSLRSGASGGGGGRTRTTWAEDDVSGSAGGGVGESGLRAHGSDPESVASPATGGSKKDGDAAASLEGGGSASDDTRRQLTSSGPGIVQKTAHKVPRRSALAGSDKSKSASRQAKPSRGVTFDDDLVGVDALDILPGSSSDEEETRGGGAAAVEVPEETPSPTAGTSTLIATVSGQQPPDVSVTTPAVNKAVMHIDGDGDRSAGVNRVPATRVALSSSERNMTEGLSPAAARLMAEDSSSEDSNAPRAGGASKIASLLGLQDPGASESSAERGHLKMVAGATSRIGLGPKDGDGEGGGSMTTADDAKLDLALGFTPSAMEGGRKPRRTLPAGRRRRSRGEVSPPPAKVENKPADSPVASTKRASIPSVSVLLPSTSALTTDMAAGLGDTTRGAPKTGSSEAQAASAAAGGEGAGDVGGSRLNRVLGVPSALPSPAEKAATAVVNNPSTATAGDTTGTGVEPSSPATAAYSPALPSSAVLSPAALPGTSNSSASGATISGTSRHESGNSSSTATASSRAEDSTKTRGVDSSVLASLERQLVLLAGEKEAVVARSARDEKMFQRDSDQLREAAAAAHSRAFESDAALAIARFVRRDTPPFV